MNIILTCYCHCKYWYYCCGYFCCLSSLHSLTLVQLLSRQRICYCSIHNYYFNIYCHSQTSDESEFPPGVGAGLTGTSRADQHAVAMGHDGWRCGRQQQEDNLKVGAGRRDGWPGHNLLCLVCEHVPSRFETEVPRYFSRTFCFFFRVLLLLSSFFLISSIAYSSFFSLWR